MAPTTKSRSKCKICGEKILQTGQYKVKIKPAKKLPAKALKLFGDPRKTAGIPGDPNLDESLWGLNKFHTYLKKKYLAAAARTNALIITCKNCSSKSTIPLKRQGDKKEKYSSASSTPKQTPTPSLSLFDSSSGVGGNSSIFDLKSSRKKAKKSSSFRDLHAGLKIPPSLLNSSTLSQTSTSALSAKEKSKRDNETPLPSSGKSIPGRKSMSAGSSGSSSTSMNKVKLKKDKGKDVDGLRRTLFFNSLSKDQKK